MTEISIMHNVKAKHVVSGSTIASKKSHPGIKLTKKFRSIGNQWFR